MVVDIRTIVRWLDDTEAYDVYERIALSEIDTLSLVYERDLANPASHPATVERVFDWLGLEHEEVGSSLVKQVPQRSIEELVANYAELQSALSGSRFEALLD